jgi:hypothetical protein
VRLKHYEHDEQFDELHPAQPDPELADDDLYLYPTENPKVDIFFTGFLSHMKGIQVYHPRTR